MTDLQRFSQLFRGRESCYGQYDDGVQKRVKTIRDATPDQAWITHLAGQGPYLGIVPIRTDNTCYFGAIDVDDDRSDHVALETKVLASKLPLVVCRSKSGGAHLYLFLKEPVPAKVVVDQLRSFLGALGLKDNADGRPIEIFPKQIKARPEDVGNWINLPYYGSDQTNRYAVIGGERATLAQFLDYAESHRLTELGLRAIRVKDPVADALPGSPPCLRALYQSGMPDGMRNQGLYNMGVYLKMSRPDDWQDALDEYNATKVQPPVERQELAGIIKSLERREYIYKCNEPPIAQLCDRGQCKKERFGILKCKGGRDEGYPTLTGLTKIMTDPPRYTLTVNGEVIELDVDDFMHQMQFRKSCFAKLNLVVPVIKPGDWDDMLHLLMESLVTVEAPEDAGVHGQFFVHLDMFTERSRQARGRDDLLRGLPIEEDGKVYFRSADLVKFLERQKFRDFELGQMYTVLHRIGAGSTKFKIRGTIVRVWWVPLRERQTEPFEAPVGENPAF